MQRRKLSKGISLPRLREVRKSAGVRLSVLSRDTGLEYSFLWKLEHGKANAGYDTLNLLLERLSVTTEDLTAPV